MSGTNPIREAAAGNVARDDQRRWDPGTGRFGNLARGSGRFPVSVKPAADKFIVYHNVFSLSRPNEFDLGMYKQGLSRSKVFDTDSVNVALTIDADRSLPAFVPDKTGKPRQPQLGY